MDDHTVIPRSTDGVANRKPSVNARTAFVNRTRCVNAAALLAASLFGLNCGPVSLDATEQTASVSQGTHALIAPWKETDIGAVGVAGDSANDGTTIAVYGSGADIWGNADAFHYVYQRLNGNTQVVVKVTSVLNTNA